MTAAAEQTQSENILERLPPVRGRVSAGGALARVTWFRVGGAPDAMFKPADLEDLQDFLANTPHDIPVLALGVGSNLLVRDGGISGVVLRLGGSFTNISVVGTEIEAGAGALDANVAKTAASKSLAGLEFFSGIPGTIGGALRMNAGAYGGETKDVLLWAEAVDRNGVFRRLFAEEMGFGYRHCSVPDDWIFTRARFKGVEGDEAEIRKTMEKIQESRGATQPIRSRTGGSTFRNPPGGKAWQAIDAAGCRGLTQGGAMVSDQHCNFLINTGDATAADLENLGEEVRKRVLDSQGIELAWEIKRIGRAAL